jgi:hypothetical protein
MIARLGVAAGFDISVHPRMLRHACGYQDIEREYALITGVGQEHPAHDWLEVQTECRAT